MPIHVKPIMPSGQTTPPRSVPGNRGYRPGKMDIWLLGITTVIGGQYFSWNMGLSAGVYGYLIAIVLVSAAYIAFCCCLAEVTGALPFAGGSYGLARCTLGFFPAFLIGCAEALEYTVCVASSFIVLGGMCVQAIPGLVGLEPLVWLVLYSIFVAIQVRGGAVFWMTSGVIGVVSLGILLIFCFGGIPFMDFKANAIAYPSVLFIDGASGFMGALPFVACYYMGIEALNLASDDVDPAKTVIPLAQVLCILSLVATGIASFVVSVAIPMEGGIAAIAQEIAPLNNGFGMILNVSASVATALSVPATCGVAYGFMWASAKLIHAMATSRLLPAFLAISSKRFRTPHVALIVGSIIGYGICLLVYFYPECNRYVFPLNLLAGYVSYTGQCIGYISLKVNYALIKQSTFKNPFGIAGGLFSMVVWVLCIVSILGFQGNLYVVSAVVVALPALLAIYYYGYARSRQRFSEEENKVLLVAHVMKFNTTRGKRRAHNRGNPTSIQRIVVSQSNDSLVQAPKPTGTRVNPHVATFRSISPAP